MMHRPSGKSTLGFALTAAATLCWGVQPIAMGVVAKTLPSSAIAFSKFFCMATVLGAFLAASGRLPRLKVGEKRILSYLFLSAAGLGASAYLFAMSFIYLPPSNAQVYAQLSRFFLTLIGVLVLKESFSRIQWLGLGVLVTGFIIFNQDQSGLGLGGAGYGLGVVIAVLSALTWAGYAVFQKELQGVFSSQQALFMICAGAALFFAPLADYGSFRSLDTVGWMTLLGVSLSTLAAYSLFSEALNHWDASRAGALSAMAPLSTIAVTIFLGESFPTLFASEKIGPIAVAGAVLVIIGSVLVSFFGMGRASPLKNDAMPVTTGQN